MQTQTVPDQYRRHQGRPEVTNRSTTDIVSRSTTDNQLSSRDALYAEFTPLVRRLVRQYGVDSEMRNDLHGEIYCRFCDLLEAFDPDRGVPLRPYLVRQLSASVFTYARKQWTAKRRETALDVEFNGSNAYLNSIDPTPSWDAELNHKQIAASLPAALQKLSERQQRVVVWRYYEDRSFEEISQRLGIESATARSLLRHGLANLRKQMAAAS